MMKVELIAYTQRPGATDGPNPLCVVEQAASMCYDSQPTQSYAITKKCVKSGHTSVLEHISFTFQISGVSRALLAQLTRHRLASYSVRSQRYCDERGFEYVNIPTGDPAIYEKAMGLADMAYQALEKTGCHSEDARMVLPNACCTKLVMTMNARELINASRERLCARAQWEIRQLFQEMREAIEPVCPEVAGWMRPKCEADPEHPFCTEAKSCKKHPKLDEVYRKPEPEDSSPVALMPEDEYETAFYCHGSLPANCPECPLCGSIDCAYILAEQTRMRLERGAQK